MDESDCAGNPPKFGGVPPGTMKCSGKTNFMTPPRPEKKNATRRDWPPVPAFLDVQEDES